jgi:hypothetical protein
MENLTKFINICLELLIWVGLWNIFENILARFTLSKDSKLVVYLLTIIFALTMMYIINDGLGYKSTFYDPPNQNNNVIV